MPKLQLLIGMIASGKTTYSRNAGQSGVLCINDDAIVTMLHGGNYIKYDKNLKVLYKAIEHKIIELGIALDKTILIDRGLNISKDSRKRFVEIAKSLDTECEALYFENKGVLFHAQERFSKESRGYSLEYWTRVAETHNSKWQIPTIEEGFSRVIKLERNCEIVL